jgi:hypothetical protein
MTRRNFDYPQRPDDQRSNGEFHQFRDKFFAQLMSAEVVRQHPNGTHLHQLAPLATKVLALADSESAVT